MKLKRSDLIDIDYMIKFIVVVYIMLLFIVKYLYYSLVILFLWGFAMHIIVFLA